jgi:hypothetical protein
MLARLLAHAIRNNNEKPGFGFRVDANNDGDFDDGGAETWSAWFCETSATDMNEWASEPWDGSISFGLIDGTYSYQVDVDDLEISNAQPTWD